VYLSAYNFKRKPATAQRGDKIRTVELIFVFKQTLKIKRMLLFYSSFVFLGNTATTFYKKHYLYAAAFFGLTLTSLVNHWDPTPTKICVDQLFVASVVLNGGWVFYNKLPVDPALEALVVSLFVMTGYLYAYGLYAQEYCFHPDHGDLYHCLLHLIASFCHHLIAFM